MTIQEQILADVSKAFEALFNHTVDASDLSLQPTRKEFAGNYTFVMFPYGKITKTSPEQGGIQIGEYLKSHSAIVSDYNVVKGFLNIAVADKQWLKLLDRKSTRLNSSHVKI